MNTNEFINAINQHAPKHLGLADREFLQRYRIILGSGPFYQQDIAKAINLLSVEKENLDKVRGKEYRRIPGAPPVAIAQVIIIHNSNAKQCHRIRQGLLQTGLIHYAGNVYVNFSPFTKRTISSLPADAFVQSDYHMEYSHFEQVLGEGKTKPVGQAINPVFFAKDLEPTVVQNYLILAGKKMPEIGSIKQLPSPLYQAFLNVDSSSAEAIMAFMNSCKVYLFPMYLFPEKVAQYVDSRKSLQLGLIGTQEQLKKSWFAQQEKMRDILKAVANNQLGQIAFPPLFPICENALVEWRLIACYFDRGLMNAAPPQNTVSVLFEDKFRDNSEEMVAIRRYYGWDSYMWAELIDNIYRHKAAQICANCGRVISPGKHGGKQKRYCSNDENPLCFKEHMAKRARASRKGRKR